MSDDTFADDEGGTSAGPSLPSITRLSNVTESHDRVFDVLSVARRRYLVYYLLELNGNVVEFEAAANAVYEYEAAGPGSDDDTSRETVRIDLHHIQLPWLADAGIVEYDRRQGTIRFREDPALAEWAEYARRKELD